MLPNMPRQRADFRLAAERKHVSLYEVLADESQSPVPPPFGVDSLPWDS
jgi:hypothetical protein